MRLYHAIVSMRLYRWWVCVCSVRGSERIGSQSGQDMNHMFMVVVVDVSSLRSGTAEAEWCGGRRKARGAYFWTSATAYLRESSLSISIWFKAVRGNCCNGASSSSTFSRAESGSAHAIHSCGHASSVVNKGWATNARKLAKAEDDRPPPEQPVPVFCTRPEPAPSRSRCAVVGGGGIAARLRMLHEVVAIVLRPSWGGARLRLRNVA